MTTERTVPVRSGDDLTVARYAPDAGMVCCSLTVSGEERLGQRQGLEAYAERGSTMGIPLLYPWANRLAAHGFEAAGKRVELPADPARIHQESSGLPLHGVTPSLMRWRVLAADRDRLVGELDWRGGELFELFPFAHRVELEAVAGPGTLTVTTTVLATDADRVPVSFGFHPYLLLHGAPRAEWDIELPPCRALALDERQLPTGERLDVKGGPVRLSERAFDDAYELLGPGGEFVAKAPGRRLAVELIEGFGFAQVFSPAGADFVCFEPMTAPANALRSSDGLRVLEPGERHRTCFRVSVTS